MENEAEEEDDDDEENDDDEDDEEDDEEAVRKRLFFVWHSDMYYFFDNNQEDDLEEIDATAIRPRRTRGVRVDYTSADALKKAGLEGSVDNDEEPEFKDNDENMKD
jgi:hypothetical protein